MKVIITIVIISFILLALGQVALHWVDTKTAELNAHEKMRTM